ncbi:MAG TPA: ABC transporter ATP-binding protein [Acidimicrobiales bacterium]|nr:ABC transporter ATP-binding protein [Acidimicrobiales bacterium]
MTAPASTISLEGVGYGYPAWATSERPVPVLWDVGLELRPGLVVVTGDSGSGKSTLLRVCNGLVPHFHGGRFWGRATVCGMDVVSTPTRVLARHVGFVFQEPEVGFVRGTVEREVAFGPENLGLPRARIRRLVADALEQVGVDALAGRRIRTLSGGERQRVALAAALAADPAVLVMDEPTSQLDDDGARALTATLGRLAADGRTVVVAEHRLGRFSGADRMLCTADAGVADLEHPPARERPLLPPPRGRAREAEAWALHDATVGLAGRPLVSEVDVAGRAGEVVVVTGANGSGKTTLLRTIAGLVPPLSGRLERRPGRVAYLPQEPGVLLHRPTVRAEVEQTLRWTGTAGRADEVLGLLGLSAIAERDPRDLSVGQRQRAALAAVLAGGPKLALLDEPTRGMDGAARRSLAGALRALADSGAGVVLATHDEELADELAERVLRIEGGVLQSRALVGDS